MLIDASVDRSSERRPYVITGSHNLDFFSLHTNDETMLIIQDRATFDSYLDFWNRIDTDARASGKTLIYGDGTRVK
jgi:phosphatidylserine/phosphatidylglycerophosphate/cardiolipin synthase-like enzyme